MQTNLDHIFIFKTDIRSIGEDCRQTLDLHPGIIEWSVDTSDTDCVLRIVSEKLNTNYLCNLIQSLGHECIELD
jgi:hypothetical protein